MTLYIVFWHKVACFSVNMVSKHKLFFFFYSMNLIKVLFSHLCSRCIPQLFNFHLFLIKNFYLICCFNSFPFRLSQSFCCSHPVLKVCLYLTTKHFLKCSHCCLSTTFLTLLLARFNRPATESALMKCNVRKVSLKRLLIRILEEIIVNE